jgi:hypothetical protein
VFAFLTLRSGMMAEPRALCCMCAESGWINHELFVLWLIHFTSCTNPRADSPVLLHLDGAPTRFQLEVIKWCRANHIHILISPAHSTAWAQVTDVTCFGVVKVCLPFLLSPPPLPS